MSYYYSEAFEQALDIIYELLDTHTPIPYEPFFSEDYIINTFSLEPTAVRHALNHYINHGKLIGTPTTELYMAPPKTRRNMLKMASLSETMANK